MAQGRPTVIGMSAHRTAEDPGRNHWWRHPELLEHDRRGYQLSLDLQSALGLPYRVEYHFETGELPREIRQSR